MLVYCPHIGGHRPIYCKRICESFARMGAKVFLFALGFEKNVSMRVFVPHSSDYIDELSRHSNVTFCDSSNGFELFMDERRFIVSLQEKHSIDVTFFIDGDAMIPMLLSMEGGRTRLLGKNFGLFIRTEFFHTGEGEGKAELPWSPAIYRNLYRSIASGEAPLDGALITDEALVESCCAPHCRSFPDVILPEVEQTTIEDQRLLRLKYEIESYRSRNDGRSLILFFGDLENRKGFHFVLKYCAEKTDTFLLRVGQTKPGYSPIDMGQVRDKAKLVLEGRIMEIDAFVHDLGFVNYVFGLTNVMPLPYQKFYRTSGLMLEAIARGKPVLVPDVGVMGNRVRENELGVTLKTGSFEAFRRGMDFLLENAESFKENLYGYAKRYSDAALDEALKDLLESVCGNTSGECIRVRCGEKLRKRKGDWIDILKDRMNWRVRSRRTRRKKAIGRFVKLASEKRVAIFGGGTYASWLEQMTKSNPKVKVVAVIDSRPNPNMRFWGNAVESAESFDASRVDAIILATEAFQKEMKRACRDYFGRSIQIVGL